MNKKTKRLPNERVSKSSFVSKNLIKSFTINRAAKLAHLNRQIRKITKTKGAFTSDNALLKLAYLAIMNMDKLWNKTVFSWREILSEISIIFADRIADEDFEL